ncbi:hypothetical protein [Stakelama tenebrarum]|uniref:Lipoprotein n=1 Tax=Stakelama tenebrarum TaxID=2711215 RepID=A0A6G6Y8V7_9SPHN|nr:hypothetical protein [Sphingosinithalassobacter tenebrarum]QIG81237.1 hypothetical protein G5C33_16605 [Sphingosinithalassobacter tenebrarum]
MRTVSKVVISLSCLSLGGCGMLNKEFRYPGGYPGYLMDQRLFEAKHSKTLALFRLTMVLAITARVGEPSVLPEDADAFADQLAEAANEINYAAMNLGYVGDADADADAGVGGCRIYPVGPAPAATPTPTAAPTPVVTPTPQAVPAASALSPVPASVPQIYNPTGVRCAGYLANFESDLPRIESRLIRGMLTALPTEQARKFLESLGRGNVFSAAWNLFNNMTDITAALHRGSAVFRSGLEIVASDVDRCHMDGTDGRLSPRPNQDQMTVYDAARCLGLSHRELFDSDDIEGEDLGNRPVPRAAFDALMRIARASCVALPLANRVEGEDVIKAWQRRRDACAKIRFDPRPRPDVVEIPTGEDFRNAAPAAEASPTPSPTAGASPTPSPSTTPTE